MLEVDVGELNARIKTYGAPARSSFLFRMGSDIFADLLGGSKIYTRVGGPRSGMWKDGEALQPVEERFQQSQAQSGDSAAIRLLQR